jgi:hypothetical protein
LQGRCIGNLESTMKHDRRRVKASATMILVAVLFVAPGALAATAPIYKCLDGRLGLIYTDQPCKGGEQLDIHPGDADPAAAARLARARDELDRSAAARIVELRRAAAQKDLAALAQRQRDADRSAAYASDSSSSYSSDEDLIWYPAYLPTRPRHSTHSPHERPPQIVAPHGFAPNPPYTVPRS